MSYVPHSLLAGGQGRKSLGYLVSTHAYILICIIFFVVVDILYQLVSQDKSVNCEIWRALILFLNLWIRLSKYNWNNDWVFQTSSLHYFSGLLNGTLIALTYSNNIFWFGYAEIKLHELMTVTVSICQQTEGKRFLLAVT